MNLDHRHSQYPGITTATATATATSSVARRLWSRSLRLHKGLPREDPYLCFTMRHIVGGEDSAEHRDLQLRRQGVWPCLLIAVGLFIRRHETSRARRRAPLTEQEESKQPHLKTNDVGRFILWFHVLGDSSFLPGEKGKAKSRLELLFSTHSCDYRRVGTSKASGNSSRAEVLIVTS